jgi:hypothetical protein
VRRRRWPRALFPSLASSSAPTRPRPFFLLPTFHTMTLHHPPSRPPPRLCARRPPPFLPRAPRARLPAPATYVYVMWHSVDVMIGVWEEESGRERAEPGAGVAGRDSSLRAPRRLHPPRTSTRCLHSSPLPPSHPHPLSQ